MFLHLFVMLPSDGRFVLPILLYTVFTSKPFRVVYKNQGVIEIQNPGFKTDDVKYHHMERLVHEKMLCSPLEIKAM